MTYPENTPWVAILYGTIEPVGRRGGGIHNAVISQAVGLMANGVSVKLFTASEACAAEARSRGIPVDLDRAWNSGIDPLFSWRIWSSQRLLSGRLPAAVIHNSGRTWLAGALLFPGVLNVQVLHRERIAPYMFFRHWIALSEGYARELKKTWSGRLRRIAIAPNGLSSDPPPYRPRQRSGPVVFGVVGRLGHIKGTDVLIEAAKMALKGGADVHFKIAGSAPAGLRAEIDKRGIASRVELVGWTDDVDAFLEGVDVFCLASRKEPFGIVLIEAMAGGLPVLSTATNGALDIVVPGETGWLVPIDDANALNAAIVAVSSDRSEIVRRAVASHAHAVDCFTPRPVGKKLLQALASLGAPLNADNP